MNYGKQELFDQTGSQPQGGTGQEEGHPGEPSGSKRDGRQAAGAHDGDDQ